MAKEKSTIEVKTIGEMVEVLQLLDYNGVRFFAKYDGGLWIITIL